MGGAGRLVLPVSLIMTVLNEEGSMMRVLDSISSQSALPSEIVIVDGGSSDTTVQIIENWARTAPCSVIARVRQGANISQGRNLAIDAATQDFIAVTDAGTILDRTWLEAIWKPLASGADVSSGFFRPAGDSFFSKLLADVTVPAFKEVRPDTFLPSSRSVAFRKQAWKDVGGYPEWLDYCEDLLFGMALRARGFSFVFAPDAEVAWAGRSSAGAFAKQYYRYSRGDGKASLWFKRHALRYGAYGFLLIALARRSRWGIIGAACVHLAYQSKFLRRVYTRRRNDTLECQVGSLILTLPIVLTGDMAKMTGYPVGVASRWRHHRDRGVRT
jgi:glycosyltransferase involved in cell wall biosynthesis